MKKTEHKNIMAIAMRHRLHKDRAIALNSAGYVTEMAFMGSGGVGQVKDFPKLDCTRIQVGCGYCRNNRALCVRIHGDV